MPLVMGKKVERAPYGSCLLMPLLVIGKSKRPRCLKNVKGLPIDYMANYKAWMTADFFYRWLERIDRKFAAQNRKVVLILDNCNAPSMVFENIKLCFLRTTQQVYCNHVTKEQ